MAENIKIAEFELDTTRLQNSLEKLQDSFLGLRKESLGYTNLLKEQQKAANALTKQQIELAAAGKETSDEYKENEKLLEDLNAAMVQNQKNQLNTANNIARVRTELAQTNKQLQAYMDSEGRQTTLIKAGNLALERQINNKNDAKAANIELNRVSNQLNPSIAEEAELLAKVNAQIDANTDFIKENTSAIGQQKINVGNYTQSIKDAIGEQAGLNNGLTGFLQAAQEAGGAAPLLKNTLSTITSGIGAATKAGLAFIATPIGAVIAGLAATVAVVVGAFKLMTASMNSTEQGANKLSKASATLDGVYNSLFKTVRPLGEWLGDAFVNNVDIASGALLKLGDVAAKGLKLLGFDKASESLSNFTGEIKKGISDAVALEEAEQALNKANREAQLTQLNYQKTAEKIRQLRDDESKSIPERIAANQKLGEVLKEQMKAELSIAQQALKVADLRIKAEGESTQALDERAEALTRIADIQERITGQESEQLANLNSLRKEAADKAKELAEKQAQMAQESAKRNIDALQAELDYYLKSQGERKKSMAEQLEIDRETLRQQNEINRASTEAALALNKEEYRQKKKSKADYLKEAETIQKNADTQELANQQEFLAKQVEATVANAELEYELLVAQNQRKAEAGQLLNDTLYQQEIDRLNKLTEQAQAIETLRYEQGLISLEQYQLAIAELDQQDYENRQAVEQERKDTAIEAQSIDLANEAAANEDNFLIQQDIRKQQLEAQQAQELASIDKTGASEVDIKNKYAAMQKSIDQQTNEFKVNAAISTLGSLAAIAGKESAAGKALAIAQTTIETYKSATSAYSSLSGIPIVGPVLGAIAAAAAIAAGIANVKKIVATKEPKVDTNVQRPSYAKGGINIQGAGSSTSDSISANISAGESVITARGTSLFPNTLGAINSAGGGGALDGQLASAITQNQIQDRQDSTQMAAMIAEAVAIGAERGTSRGAEQGMTNLSDNRQIMANAKF